MDENNKAARLPATTFHAYPEDRHSVGLELNRAAGSASATIAGDKPVGVTADARAY
jgi:hypothetical protein